MSTVTIKKNGNTMIIGDRPQLIVDLKNQKNFIDINGKKIPYKREVVFSKDLLDGKRKAVFDTAVQHYYRQACQVADGYLFVEKYRSHANTTVREVK